MNEELNIRNTDEQSRIEEIEREYEATIKKELNILNEVEFWNLESSKQWQYIQYLEGEITSYAKNMIQEAEKQSLQGYTLQNLNIPEFLKESDFWGLDKESQWFYVNETLVKKYWDLRIELRNLQIRPGFNKLLETVSEITENWPEFRESADKDRRFYRKIIENGYKIETRKMF